MKAVAFIFARGGSKGLPGKNIRPFNGKPLIAWSIEQARSVSRIHRVIVSTDSIEIAQVALQYGAEVPFIRPPELAQDDSPEWLSWRHAIKYLYEETGSQPEAIVSVPATAPLRLPLDIDACLDEYQKGGADMVITVTDAHRSPYFNMVKIGTDGAVGLVNPPQSALSRRQDVPVVYDMTTICYVMNPDFVITHNATFEGRVKAVYVPIERAIDIDTLFDFQVAEALIKIKG
jgi:N-acylneuraminate cytidylyltransferase